MKDRIKQLMESQHMTQQVFADFLGLAPATLSGIFNDRTRPTLNVVELIKKKFPDISTDWIMFGKEPMFVSSATAINGPSVTDPSNGNRAVGATSNPTSLQDPTLDFGQSLSPTPSNSRQPMPNYHSVRSTHLEIAHEDANFFNKPQRRVTEIRVYYDDQTWESFVPSKK